MNFKPSGTKPKTTFQIYEVEYSKDGSYTVKRMVDVVGFRVWFKSHHPFSFFMHHYKEMWAVSEECTGLQIGSGETQQAAYRQARQNLAKWKWSDLGAKIRDHLSWRDKACPTTPLASTPD